MESIGHFYYVMIKFVDDKIINIKSLIHNAGLSTRNFNAFFGKTKDTFLLGPLINNKLCKACLRKRIVSSSVFDASSYLETTKKDELRILELFNKNTANLSDTIFEYERKTGKSYLINIHNIQQIPGCNDCASN